MDHSLIDITKIINFFKHVRMFPILINIQPWLDNSANWKRERERENCEAQVLFFVESFPLEIRIPLTSNWNPRQPFPRFESSKFKINEQHEAPPPRPRTSLITASSNVSFPKISNARVNREHGSEKISNLVPFIDKYLVFRISQDDDFHREPRRIRRSPDSFKDNSFDLSIQVTKLDPFSPRHKSGWKANVRASDLDD